MEKEILCFENIHRNNNRIWMLNTVLANIGRLGRKRTVRTVRTMGVASLYYITYVIYLVTIYAGQVLCTMQFIQIFILSFEFKVEYLKAIPSFLVPTTSGTNWSMPFVLI